MCVPVVLPSLKKFYVFYFLTFAFETCYVTYQSTGIMLLIPTKHMHLNKILYLSTWEARVYQKRSRAVI